MKKLISLICAALLLPLAGCMVTLPYGGLDFDAFRSNLRAEHGAVFRMFVHENVGYNLECECDAASGTELSEAIEIFYELTDYLFTTEFLDEYFAECGVEYDSGVPDEPVYSRNPGPRMNIGFNLGGKWLSLDVSFTRSSGLEDDYRRYVYDGSWRRPNPLVLHREDMNSESAAEPGDFGADSLTSHDFDGDGETELLALDGESAVMFDGDSARRLEPEKLIELLLARSDIHPTGEDYTLSVAEVWFRLPAGITGGEPELELLSISRGGECLEALFAVAVDGTAIGELTVPIFYDHELGFRAGEWL